MAFFANMAIIYLFFPANFLKHGGNWNVQFYDLNPIWVDLNQLRVKIQFDWLEMTIKGTKSLSVLFWGLKQHTRLNLSTYLKICVMITKNSTWLWLKSKKWLKMGSNPKIEHFNFHLLKIVFWNLRRKTDQLSPRWQ